MFEKIWNAPGIFGPYRKSCFAYLPVPIESEMIYNSEKYLKKTWIILTEFYSKLYNLGS